MTEIIYNSRNYYRLLNNKGSTGDCISTTVEITIGYLTIVWAIALITSTTVEITIGYLTYNNSIQNARHLQQ